MEYFWFDNDDCIGIIRVAKHYDDYVEGQARYVEHQGNYITIGSLPTSVSNRYLIYDGTNEEWNTVDYLSRLMDKEEYRKYMRGHKLQWNIIGLKQ